MNKYIAKEKNESTNKTKIAKILFCYWIVYNELYICTSWNINRYSECHNNLGNNKTGHKTDFPCLIFS